MTRLAAELDDLADVVELLRRGRLAGGDAECQEKFANVLLGLAELANIFDVDLGAAFQAKAAAARGAAR